MHVRGPIDVLFEAGSSKVRGYGAGPQTVLKMQLGPVNKFLNIAVERPALDQF